MKTSSGLFKPLNRKISTSRGSTLSELSSSIYSNSYLDNYISELITREQALPMNHSTSELGQSLEDREIGRLQRLASQIKGRQTVLQIISVLEDSQSELVRTKSFDFFMDFLIRPNDIYSKSIVSSQTEPGLLFHSVLGCLHLAFSCFSSHDQITMLDSLSRLLILLSPDPKVTNAQLLPFQVYEDACIACKTMLDSLIEEGYPTNDIEHFVTDVLSNLITVSCNVSTFVRQTKMKMTSYAGYIGELLPFIASARPLCLTQNEETTKLLQQIWIILVLFSGSHISSFFSQWDDSFDIIMEFMPPLILKTPSVDFASVKFRTQELMRLIQPQSMQKAEDVHPLIVQALPQGTVNLKSLQQLELVDSVYALSIFALESRRADSGIFGPIFEYFEKEYYPAFSAVLQPMFIPVYEKFNVFLVNCVDFERRSESVAYAMSTLFKEYTSPSASVQSNVDQIIIRFASSNPSILCSKNVLQSLADVGPLFDLTVDPTRQEFFRNFVSGLIQRAFQHIPFSTTAAMCLYILEPFFGQQDQSSFSTLNSLSSDSINFGAFKFLTSSSFEYFYRQIPSSYQKFFMNCVLLIAQSHGSVSSLLSLNLSTQTSRSSHRASFQHMGFSQYRTTSSGSIRLSTPSQFSGPTVRSHIPTKALDLALYIVVKARTNQDLSELYPLIECLITPGRPQNESLLLWSLVSQASIPLSVIMLNALIAYFVQTKDTRQGFFSNSGETSMIDLQTNILRFFIESSILERHYSDFISCFSSAASPVFSLSSNPHCLIALYHYAYLACLVLSQQIPMSTRNSTELELFIIKILLTAHSYTIDPRVYAGLGECDLEIMEYLIEIIPKTESYVRDNIKMNSGHQRKSSFSINSVDLSSSKYLSGKISSLCRGAVGRAQLNYANSSPVSQDVITVLLQFVAYLLCEDYILFSSFFCGGNISPLGQRLLTASQMKLRDMKLQQSLPVLWRQIPSCLASLCELPRIGKSVCDFALQLCRRDPFSAASSGRLALVLAKEDRFVKSTLFFWSPLPPTSALVLLTPEIMKDPSSAEFVTRCFNSFSREEGLLYIPQLVQALRFDACGALRKFLMIHGKKSELFKHALLWNIDSEKSTPVGENDKLPELLQQLEVDLINDMTPEEHSRYEAEFGFIDSMSDVSTRLKQVEMNDRPSHLVDMLSNLHIDDQLYIPSNPRYHIISIDAEHSVPLKSHAKVPIFVKFQVYDEKDEQHTPMPFSCIFKVQDDVRQDSLMIQFIDVFDQIFTQAGIPHYLLPYRVFATGKDRGVIEVIQNAKSRHDLGRATNEYLLQYYISKYGPIGSPGFEKALSNFIESMAPYSLICYLFQVKDRHNANIMIDEDGHLIHIDFGFIFEISPGGNLKFERAPFKLNREMIELMGGSKEAAPFKRFQDLLTRCFFAARSRHSEIEALADLMRTAGFPCFNSDSITKLQERFLVGCSPKEVIKTVNSLIGQAYENGMTTLYDAFQAKQNRIYF